MEGFCRAMYVAGTNCKFLQSELDDLWLDLCKYAYVVHTFNFSTLKIIKSIMDDIYVCI